jgi:putative chitinase
MLQAAAPKTKDSVLLNFLPSLNKICGKYDINSKLRKAHFLAQVAVESGGFRYTKEIWGPTEIQKLYEPPSRKASGLGNTQPGDGERFKGRGLIQITGRYNYTAFASSINMSLEDVTAYMETTDGAVESAAWYWIAHFKKNGNIISDEGASESVVTKVSKYVNGGTIGLSERQASFARIYPIST